MNLQLGQIPAHIDTVEKLHAWSAMLLHRANPTLKNLEAPNFSDYVCQVSIFTADDGSIRLVARLNLEIDPAYQTSGLKLWQNVKEFSEIAIPAGYSA